MRPAHRIASVLATIGFLLAARPAPAHGLSFSVETTTDRLVRIGGFYEGGTPVRGAAVTVCDGNGQTVFEGRTDADGYACFKPPGSDVYRFTIDDAAGHRIRERFVLRTFQLDGKVRDLWVEGGIPVTVLEQLRGLPRWLTAIFGLSLLLNVFVILAWIRRVRGRKRMP